MSNHHTPSIFDGIDLTEPEHKGYLFKQSRTHTGFNRRYGVLYKKLLVYYENEDHFKRDARKGALEHYHKVIRLDGLYLTKPEKKPIGGRFCFILHTPNKMNDRHEYLLVTHTREERRNWMEKLQNLNPNLLAAPSSYVRPDTPVMGRSSRDRSSHREPSPSLNRSVSPHIDELDVREGLSDSED